MSNWLVGELRRLLNATRYSFSGLLSAYKNEKAFRLEVWIFTLMLPVPFCSGVDSAHMSLMLFSLFCVLIAELVNTAIEALADQISIERHDLLKRAKDCGSAAVFLALLMTLLIWGNALFSI